MNKPVPASPAQPKRPDFREMSGEEAEAWLRSQEGWEDCFMHIHGPECAIISHRFATTRKIRETNPDFKYICGPDVIIPIKWAREQQKPREDYLWKLTASWVYEKARSKFLAEQLKEIEATHDPK